MKLPLAALLLALFVAACSRTTVQPADWQRMPPGEKTLWIRQMIGAERARAAKGGNDHTWSQPPQSYVQKINEAYARGDRRDVRTLFESLGDHR